MPASTLPAVTPGQTLENPVTGERFTFTHTAASTGGELLAFELGLRPGGAVPIPHVHPIQTERFEVVRGQMRFRVGLRTVVAGPGETVEVAPGVMHGFANAGDEEAIVRVEVRPALAMEEMFGQVVALARDGGMTSRGLPRNLLDLALLARTYDREAHAPFVTVGLQRVLLAPLVGLARARLALKSWIEHRLDVEDRRAVGRLELGERVRERIAHADGTASLAIGGPTFVTSGQSFGTVDSTPASFAPSQSK